MWTLEPSQDFFDADQRAEVDVLFERLLPADPESSFPGARAARASVYVSRLLGRTVSTYREIPVWRELYPELLASLGRTITQRTTRTLNEASDAEVDALLRDLQAGAIEGLDSATQRLWFKTLLRHCIQGCFGDPRWGGNVDGIMWKWIGYPAEEGR